MVKLLYLTIESGILIYILQSRPNSLSMPWFSHADLHARIFPRTCSLRPRNSRLSLSTFCTILYKMREIMVKGQQGVP